VDRIWIDFNSLAVEACWTSGGPNASCPYSQSQRDAKYVIVPSVAAVIVLILFGLFMLVKLANVRVEKGRRRRKKEWKRFEGHDYEGVPA